MMSRRFLFLGVLAIAAASATMAEGQVVIGNFEGGSLDGWGPSFGGTQVQLFPDNSPGYGAAFATNGTYALDVLAYAATPGTPSGSFRWSLEFTDGDLPNLAQIFAANPIVAADVSWRTDEWSADLDGVWARWDKASINNSVSGWQEAVDAQMDDTVNPSFPGSWDQANYGATHTRTVRWNFNENPNVNLAAIGAGATWFQINISTNYDGAYNTAGGSFWIDNIRLEPLAAVPEPSTLAMAGLAGLLPFLRRRSRR